jgi:hypothetical protein
MKDVFLKIINFLIKFLPVLGLTLFGNSVMGSGNLPPCKGPDKSNWTSFFWERTYINRDQNEATKT